MGLPGPMGYRGESGPVGPVGRQGIPVSGGERVASGCFNLLKLKLLLLLPIPNRTSKRIIPPTKTDQIKEERRVVVDVLGVWLKVFNHSVLIESRPGGREGEGWNGMGC